MQNQSKMTLNKQELDKQALRANREKLLKAWDIMVANIAFGTKQVTENRKQELIQWHRDILDLKESAFVSVPEEVKYYIK